jgi:hypothetical protein
MTAIDPTLPASPVTSRRAQSWTCLLFVLPMSLLATDAAAQLQPSADNLFVTESDGTPVFLNGESAWCLFTGLTVASADSFFANCESYGINYLQTMLIEDGFTDDAPVNIHGVAPFSGAPFVTPVEGYFAHCDSVIALAEAHGVYLQLYITYLGVGSWEGWQTEVGNASIADMKAWGAYVGQRYKDAPNIVWGVSGDCDPTAWRTKIDSMVVGGLLPADPNHLVSTRDEVGSYSHTHWPGRPWLTLDGFYPYWGPSAFQPWLIYQMAQDSRSIPGRPYLLQEAWYEDEHTYGGSTYPTDTELRQQMYYGVLGGAIAGQVFGNCPIWMFSRGPGLVCGSGNYRSWLDSPGHVSTMWCGRLFRSRYWYRLSPDTDQSVMTAGYGTYGSGDYATTSIASDGSSIIAYLPTSRAVTVDPEGLSGGSIHVFWFRPLDGDVTDEGVMSKTSRSYTPPAAGDWVLVIDSQDFENVFDVPGGDPPLVATAVTETPRRSDVTLDQNRPNPFNPTTEMSFETRRKSALSLVVYDVTGRRIRMLAHGDHPPGRYAVVWDGRDEHGRPVGSGIYFYRLRAGDVRLTKKMVLLK